MASGGDDHNIIAGISIFHGNFVSYSEGCRPTKIQILGWKV